MTKELVVIALGLIGVLLVAANTIPGCNEQTHRFHMDRIRACAESCGARGVVVNDPENVYYPCVCSH